MSVQLNKQEIMKIFFDDWKSLPLLLEFEEGLYVSTTQEARLAIIDLLAIGIDDIYPGSQEVRKRRVLSANEIKEEINEKLEQPIKKSNLYFHLQKLEDMGFIHVVDYLPYGKREIAYYGRTARVFVPSSSAEKKHDVYPVLDNEAIFNLLRAINPDVTDEQINGSLEAISGIYDHKGDALKEWMRKNEDVLMASEIDFRQLYAFLGIINRYNEKVHRGLKEIAEMLKFKQND